MLNCVWVGFYFFFISTDGRQRIKRRGHQISDLISSGQTGAVAGRIVPGAQRVSKEVKRL